MSNNLAIDFSNNIETKHYLSTTGRGSKRTVTGRAKNDINTSGFSVVRNIDTAVTPYQSVQHLRPDMNSAAYIFENAVIMGINTLIADYNSRMGTFISESRLKKAVMYLNDLKHAEGIPSQVQHISPILRVIKSEMGSLRTEKQHYHRCTLLLVKTMLLRHSGKNLLAHQQIDAMIHVVAGCDENVIDKDAFLQYHDYLEKHGLEMIPSGDD